MQIRPGMRVECAMRVDETTEKIIIRKSIVYDVLDNSIILSQTSPSLTASCTGTKIAVTHVNKSRNLRFGISGTIKDIIKNYRLSSTQTAEAVCVDDISRARRFNMRLAFRVTIPDDYTASLVSGHGDTLAISDLSATGIRFSHMHEHTFRTGQTIKLLLTVNDNRYELSATVVRVVPGRGIRTKRMEIVAAEFSGLSTLQEDRLAREVREIERHLAFKNMLG